MARYIIGITGASGSIYAVRLTEELLKMNHEVHAIATTNGHKVMEFELGHTLETKFSEDIATGKLQIHEINNLFAPVASGSFKTDGMIIVPCSMSTLGEIATGSSKTLLGRAADVCIKERRKLILVARETPLSAIHLQNMLAITQAGAMILPATPAFYQKPKNLEDIVDFIVGKILDSLGLEHELYRKWGAL